MNPIAPVILANTGIPFFTQSVRYQVLLFIPIVAIEACVHAKLLGLSAIKAFYIALVTNLFSTLVGAFLLVLFGVAIGQLIFQSTVPVQPFSLPFAPLEVMITLIPMFFLSVVLERWTGGRGLKDIKKSEQSRSFWTANVFSYAMLMVLAMTRLVMGYLT
jgi:hypothetical protein